MNIKWNNLLKSLGPGILLAGAAIGGSHLVQSTKAGALYGFGLVWAVILANIFKYPFFEFSCRYTASTGETVIDGYKRLGRPSFVLFLLIALGSAYINVAAVTVVAAALAGNLLGIELSIFWWTVIVSTICVTLLVLGRYPALDLVIKLVVLALAISTLSAVILAGLHGTRAAAGFQAPGIWNATGIAFLIALMGWMPAPVDVSVWPSLWSVERRRQTGHRPTMREALADFHLGYIGTGFLALAFLGLGALIMFGTGDQPEAGGLAFARQLISLYTGVFGEWSRYIIAIAAFTCMFSTSLTTLDGYTRVIHSTVCLGLNRKNAHREDRLFWAVMAMFFGTTLLIVGLWMKSMGALVDFATTMAFLTAPLMAMLNYRIIRSAKVPQAHQPPRWLLILSWMGLVFLFGFALLYIITRFLPI